LKHVLQKNEENKSCRKPLDLQIWFRSFFVHDSSTEATELTRKSPKLPCGPKLEAFTVLRYQSWTMDESLVDFCCLGKFVNSQTHLLRIAYLNLKSGFKESWITDVTVLESMRQD
jgi:hypothetical protein